MLESEVQKNKKFTKYNIIILCTSNHSHSSDSEHYTVKHTESSNRQLYTNLLGGVCNVLY